MKNIIIYLLVLLTSNIYAQCDNYSQSQCSNDNNCEWIENIDSGYCSDFDNNLALCNSIDQCNWTSYQIDCGTGTGYSDCVSQAGCSYSWLTYTCSGLTTVTDCGGGYYEIDNGFCEEIQDMECSGMNETECSSDDGCQWMENIELESCNNINSQQECNAVGCSWYNGNYYACSICCWGEYEVDNSYCEEFEYQLGDLNQDNIINIQDIIIAVNLVLNSNYDISADMNNDNIVNVLDIIQLVNIILN